MNRVLWIGPRAAPAQLAELLLGDDAQLLSFPSAEAALEGLAGERPAVAIITADWPEATSVVGQLYEACPNLQILMASDAGISRNVALALWGGASGVLEFKAQSRQEIVQEIKDWVTRHREREREAELLGRLHALNEEFLKEMVAAQRRILELEAEVGKSSRPLDPLENAAQILLVDDEEVVLDVLARILERKGHTCARAMTGQEALDALYERPFHLIITDKNLPDWSGLDVLRNAKQLSPDTEVMMMTGYSSKETAIQALDLGAVAYLEKPFDDVAQVLARVEAVLEKQRARLTHQHFLNVIKERNREFLETYRAVRADLEAWMEKARTK